MLAPCFQMSIGTTLCVQVGPCLPLVIPVSLWRMLRIGESDRQGGRVNEDGRENEDTLVSRVLLHLKCPMFSTVLSASGHRPCRWP